MTARQKAIGQIRETQIASSGQNPTQDRPISSQQAIFLSGKPIRHITVMTLTASVGLLTMFIVDFVDLLYIAQLGDSALTAAMGFAATILFFGTAFNIGLMIATSALASRSIGQGDPRFARRYLTNILVLSMMIMIPLAIIFFVFAPQLLELAGADGMARDAASGYIRIVAPFMPFGVAAMVCSGFLRAHGAARRAMNVTLSMGITNAVLDPIFIFGLDLGINGAAIASAIAAIVSAGVAIVPVIKSYGGFEKFSAEFFRIDLKPIMAILLPAIMTNVATPVGGFISYRFIAGYSDDVVAGFAVMGRITPVAFCLLFSLSGAVGPIIGQNFGAGKFDRIRLTIQQAMLFALGYTLLVWPLLLLLNEPIADIFNLEAQGRDLFWTFALVLTPLFFFNGILFISNAACNNLERPAWSMIMNWLRNTLGLIPFLWIGGALYGLEGILIGPAIGGIIFGILGYAVSRYLVNLHESKARASET
ncbi:putative efflux protein, MATE family [Parasphingorhabdus marina DSM 22363]|uniref:Putative efflux protein, MATE family n=2 Tax=Parasphingorhabdus marina TaxID=394732 RepID=A0A1N6D5T5_9SPHN|nr:putative efflux protein, MATE family [Parasphingorhabdus marina DSM 22363]